MFDAHEIPMTSPLIQRELIPVTVKLRGRDYLVKGFIEDGEFIAETFEPELDYNSLTDREWAEIGYRFWLQQESENG